MTQLLSINHDFRSPEDLEVESVVPMGMSKDHGVDVSRCNPQLIQSIKELTPISIVSCVKKDIAFASYECYG
jgi:hypothetical protein